jgi:hypothetical protein
MRNSTKKLSKHELLVRVKFLRIFSSVNIEKEIFIQEFFKSYPSTLNNQQKTKIKRSFIELVKHLEQHDLMNIRSPAYTYLFLWIFIKIYRKITFN